MIFVYKLILDADNSGAPIGAILGGVLAGLLVLVVIIVIVICIIKRRKKETKKEPVVPRYIVQLCSILAIQSKLCNGR